MGMSLDFWRIAMRPGKPLMFGRLDHTLVIGLPGNPVSSLICTRVFIVPLIRALLGQTGTGDRTLTAPLAVDLPANGPRQHYMRAITQESENGVRAVAPVRSQDSSLLSPLATADVLIVRPAGDPAQPAGARVRVLDLDF
jgi:molybdopterin molybdotransferase